MGIEQLQKVTIFLFLLIISSCALAKGNYVDPKPYFVGREAELSLLSKQLQKEGVAVIFGKSGTGKTQLLRKYIKQNKSKYDYIWVINASDNTSRQLEDFIKFVSVEENRTVNDIKSLFDYFNSHKKNVLISYDNIELSDEKDFFQLYTEILPDNKKNIKYIFGSQVKLGSSFIELNNLKASEVIKLLRKVTNRPIDPRKIINVTRGHPLLTYKFVEIINKNKFLTEEEVYQNFSDDFTKSFDTYINSLRKKLTKESFDCLNKLSVISNSHLDKGEIIFFCGENRGIKSLIDIQQFNILEEQVSEKGEFKGFEMHNIIKERLLSLTEDNLTKELILEAIGKVNKLFIQDADQLDQILLKYPNLLSHIEALQTRSKEYGVSNTDQFELVSNLAMLYLYYAEYDLARVQIDWIRNNFRESNLSEELIKVLAYSYISEGVLEDFQYGDAIKSEKLFKKALNLYDLIKSPPVEGLYMARTQLAQTYIYINEFSKARPLLEKAKETLDVKQKVELDKAIYYFLMAKLQYEERDLYSAEKTINEGLEAIKDRPDNHFKAPLFSLKADVLLEAQKPKQALEIALKGLNDTKKTLKIEGEVIARARLSYANCLAEFDDKLKLAEEQVKMAKIGLEKDRGKSDIKTSDDDDLAFAYFVEYKINNKKKNLKEALNSLIISINIYENRYKKNCDSAKMRSLYNKASLLAQKSGDKFLYNLYSKKHTRKSDN